MKIKIALLVLAACTFATCTRAQCYADKPYICHRATPGTQHHCSDGANVMQGVTTDGIIKWAMNASKGYDNYDFFNTTCDWVQKDTDCTGFTTSTPVSAATIEAYADGNRCGEW